MGWKNALKTVAAGLVPLLTACGGDGPAVISNYDKGEHLIESTIVYASKDGPVLAEIHGNPFTSEPSSFDQMLHGAMSDAIGGRKITYTGDPGQAPHPEIKIIILFGAADSVSGRRLCEGPLPTPAVNPDKIAIRGVLCSSGDLLSDAQGWVRNISGPEDRRFQRLLFDLTRALIKMN